MRPAGTRPARSSARRGPASPLCGQRPPAPPRSAALPAALCSRRLCSLGAGCTFGTARFHPGPPPRSLPSLRRVVAGRNGREAPGPSGPPGGVRCGTRPEPGVGAPPGAARGPTPAVGGRRCGLGERERWAVGGQRSFPRSSSSRGGARSVRCKVLISSVPRSELSVVTRSGEVPIGAKSSNDFPVSSYGAAPALLTAEGSAPRASRFFLFSCPSASLRRSGSGWLLQQSVPSGAGVGCSTWGSQAVAWCVAWVWCRAWREGSLHPLRTVRITES